MNAKILTMIDGALVAIAWVEYVDVSVRITSGLAAVFVAYFAARAYISKKRLTDIEAKIKQKDLDDRSKSNGRQ